MRLVMFDVDGTLITGNGIDDNCFAEAVNEVFGIQQIDTDWSHYKNITDSGVTAEIVEKNLGRKAGEHEINDIRRAYIKMLRLEIGKNPLNFQPVPGAVELITTLRAMEEVCICIATGGWRDSAIVKLLSAGFSIENVLITSADDSHERETILRLAHGRAMAYINCDKFDSVMYVADHEWDFLNAQKLGYSFLGIAGGKHLRELKQAGANHILPDFTDRDYFMRVLKT